MPVHPRSPPRIQPPDPITVAIEDDRGAVVAYGVMADISRRGGCIQTDVLIVSDATFGLRLSFAYPPEMHSVVGRVIWSKKDSGCSQTTAHRCGVEWLSVGYTLECRLRQLTQEAVQTAHRYRLAFDSSWVADVAGSSPDGRVLAARGNALWSPEGPQTRPVAPTGRDRHAGGAAPGGGQDRAGILRFPRSGVKEGGQ